MEPLHEAELEMAVLGAMLIEKSGLHDGMDQLQHPETFFIDSHQHIFKAIKTLWDDKNPVDLLTVINKLRDTGYLDKVGGAGAVTELTNRVASSAHIEHHCELLKQLHIRRQLKKLGEKVTGLCINRNNDLQDILSFAQRELSDIDNNAIQQTSSSTAEVLAEVDAHRKELQTITTDIIGVPSGLDIDEFTSGWQNGDLIIPAGRPGMGKTAFALQCAHAAGKAGKPGIFYSLEMPKKQLGMRMVAAQGKVALHAILKQKTFNPEVDFKYNKIFEDLTELPIRWENVPGIKFAELRAKLRKEKRDNDIQWAIIDYIQLMSGSGKENREREISIITSGLKQIAMELDIPIIALSQLSRKVEERADKMPVLSDLRESGSLEQDADMVIFVYRPEYYEFEQSEIDGHGMLDTKNLIVFIIAKHRNGKLVNVLGKWYGQYTKVERYTTDEDFFKQPLNQ